MGSRPPPSRTPRAFDDELAARPHGRRRDLRRRGFKAFNTEWDDRVHDDGDGPMGPAACLAKPALAAVEGYAVAGGLDRPPVHLTDRGGRRRPVFCRRWGSAHNGGTVRLPG
jgi:hypothetical protein